MENKPCRGRPKGTLANHAPYARALGTVVKQLRAIKKTSQEELAITAGIERSHMGKIERGEHLPSLILLIKIAVALECETAELMRRMEEHIAKADKI
ncbi:MULTISPECIES: helix-turn-helix domain-containing protein [Pseudomonas]|jgi:DNA-binding XRE family transcriptional regulator|uniref:Helix-turn-helix transcriptional regulator n=1 Tax=Pseudomonas mosselii TaxID=78327 RepID=A0A5R8ZCR8_9PSED|nr:helix-turn-helix transcriptional regulator [Pseudomonas mosselii]TLP63589.1 helix-turn-helix transcriptional regulator [Pseudomonas mosselii]